MLESLKKLAKETAIYGISSILSRFLNFLLVPFYTNFFSARDYGLIANIYAYIAFLNVIFAFGMESSYMKYSSLAETEKEKKKIFSIAYLTILVVSFISIIFLIFFKDYVLVFFDLYEDKYLYYALAILFVDALNVLPYAELRMSSKALFFASTKSLNIFINVLLNILFIAIYNFGVEGVLLANLIASLSSLAILLRTTIKSFIFSLNWVDLKKLLKFGLPYLPAGLAAIALQVIDRPILLKLTSMEKVGIYQANYKLGVFMMLFVSMFQYAYQPFFLQRAKDKDAKEIFANTLKYFLLASSLILIFLSYFIENICQITILGKSIIAKEYWTGLSIVPIVLLAYLFNGLYVNFTAGIFIKEKTIYSTIATSIGALSNIAFNFTLVPIYDIIGAAVATLLSYMIMALILFFYSQKYYKIHYDYWNIFKIFFLICAYLLLFYFLFYNKIQSISIKFGVAISYIFFVFFLKIVSYKKLKKFLTRE